MSITRRAIICCAPTLITVTALAAPALAHIDPDPTEAPAGSEQSVGFTVQHGCEGSATIELRMRLPDGVANATPEAPAGWTGSVDDNVVTFTGGPLADQIEETFRVRMILPLTPDTAIYFPFVQRCEAGEIAWIDIPADGSGTELDEPAPAMTLTAALPGTTQAPATTVAATTTSVAPATTLAPATTTTTATPTTAAPTSEPSTSEGATDSTQPTGKQPSSAEATNEEGSTPITVTAPDAESDDSDSGSGGTVVLVVVIAALVAGGVAMFIRTRRSR